MLNYTLRVTESEHKLIEAVRKVNYGEIFSPKIDTHQIRAIDLQVSLNIADMIELFRLGEPISIITIQKGEPVMAESDLLVDGFRCRKKHKLPTV